MKRRSLAIALANVVSATVVYAVLHARDTVPRLVEYLLYPFFAYFALSFLFALGGMIIGARDLRSSDNKLFELAGVVGNAIYFAAFVMMLKDLWPVLMGV